MTFWDDFWWFVHFTHKPPTSEKPTKATGFSRFFSDFHMMRMFNFTSKNHSFFDQNSDEKSMKNQQKIASTWTIDSWCIFDQFWTHLGTILGPIWAGLGSIWGAFGLPNPQDWLAKTHNDHTWSHFWCQDGSRTHFEWIFSGFGSPNGSKIGPR